MKIKACFLIYASFLLVSCNRSEIPFMNELGLNPDSLIMDSIPQPYPLGSCGLKLTESQTEKLKGKPFGDRYNDYILSIQKFDDNYLFAYANQGFVELYLYNMKGETLDKMSCGTWNYQKAEPTVKQVVCSTDSLDRPFGDYKRLDKHHFYVCCVKDEDTIKWNYTVKTDRIQLLNRQSTRLIATPSRDIVAYPYSQTYEACQLINDYKEVLPKDIICKIPALPNRYTYNRFAWGKDLTQIWQWIYDHKGNETLSESKFHAFYDCTRNEKNAKDRVTIEEFEKDINKIKDKKARQYLLRMVRGWKATNNP